MTSDAQPEGAGRAAAGELLVVGAFTLLTVAMTWPWIRHLRDFCSDAGDPYLVSWILWWDWHQTFRDPLHLFDANVFYPYRYSLAFSEHLWGIAFPFFPLFALGVRPLTVQGIATLAGFALSGYGAFRLGRTATGSMAAGWICGIAFAFVPYRIGQMPHLPYLFAGWIPILLEALILFLRRPTRGRAAWLGVAFLMNGLTSIHWLVLTLVPLGVTGVVLVFRAGLERNRDVFRRGGAAIAVASLALLPFLLPYQSAAKLYGFTRSPQDAAEYSALPRHWLAPDPHHRLWLGFAEWPTPSERALFPGLLLFLLPATALLLVGETERAAPALEDPRPPPPRGWIHVLDAIAVVAGMLSLFIAGAGPIHIRLSGHEVFRASGPRASAVFAVALLIRCWLEWPRAFGAARTASLRASLRHPIRSEAVTVGVLWVVLGFFGSLGMNFPFHRVLFELVPLFRSIRVPARWAMVAYVGLALLAAVGTLRLAEAVRRRFPRTPPWLVPLVVGTAILLENRVAPLLLTRGDADPDEITRALARTRMRGGIVELPSSGPDGNYLYVLRAADHGKPLVNGVSGFAPPAVESIERLAGQKPVPDGLLDLFELLPVSYVTVRGARLTNESRPVFRDFLDRGVASGRIRFVGRFDGGQNELYAVTKTEPR